MIAQVYVIVRLPRSKGSFDYKVPEGLPVSRGDLIKIPFRGKLLWGIVQKVKDRPERGIKLKNIERKHDEITLREAELSFFEWLAHDLAQSVSSVLKASLPLPPKNQSKGIDQSWQQKAVTLPRSESENLIRTIKRLRERREVFLTIPDLRRMSAVLTAYRTAEPDEKILIIAPTLRDVQIMAKYLSDAIVVTGEQTNNQRYRQWVKFRSSKSAVMLGTKIAALLVDQSITTIVVIHSSDSSHKQFDRNPRFDVRHVSWDLHDRFHSNLFFFDVSMRSRDLASFSDTCRLWWGKPHPTHIVDLDAERPGAIHANLSPTVEKNMRSVLERGGRVLCVLNRKGVASRLFCQGCSYKFTCDQCGSGLTLLEQVVRCPRCLTSSPAPSRCPKCGDTHIHQVGLGIDGFATLARKTFSGARVQVCSKDKPNTNQDHQILVATNYYLTEIFNPFTPAMYDLVVLVDADQPLHSAGMQATEQAIHDLALTRSIASASKVAFIIQTHELNFFSEVLGDEVAAFEQNLEILKRYDMPPFRRWFSIELREEEPRKAQAAIHQLRHELDQIEGVKLQRVREINGYYSFIGSIDHEKSEQVFAFFTDLSDQYIIDTHVYS